MFRTTIGVLAMTLLGSAAQAQEKDTRVYEMRTYWAAPGKLEALESRFREHSIKMFEKHKITNVAYFVPINNPEGKVIYLLSYPSKDFRDKAWDAIRKDEEWLKIKAATEANGKIVAKVEEIFLTPTDYSPKVARSSQGGRVFELRDYTASKGNLDNLNARFRDHTLKLFEKHGMTNVMYFVPIKGEKRENEALIYFLAHKDEAAAKKSFDAFRMDPAWNAARLESEKKGGGSLTAPNGVKSTFLKATDYSPIR